MGTRNLTNAEVNEALSLISSMPTDFLNEYCPCDQYTTIEAIKEYNSPVKVFGWGTYNEEPEVVDKNQEILNLIDPLLVDKMLEDIIEWVELREAEEGE